MQLRVNHKISAKPTFVRKMKIVYIGDSQESSTSYHRARALARLGHYIEIFDPYVSLNVLTKNAIINKFHYITGYQFLQDKIQKWLVEKLSKVNNIDLIWVDGGELFGPKHVVFLKKNAKKVILYNIDDPTGTRDKGRFASLVKALKQYDLCVVVRKSTFDEIKQIGAKVLQVSRSYDEVAHKEIHDDTKIPEHFLSDVTFIGTWIKNEKRDLFLLQLLKAGINVKVWGDRWEKSKNWDAIKNIYQGPSLKGKEYAMAIKGAKICLGLLSKGNRDLHTTRSLEIPYAGGLLCAQRTIEHTEMFLDNVEAVFWDDIDECIKVCQNLLKNSELNQTIRLNGKAKVLKLSVGNENVCSHILNSIENDLSINFNQK